MLCNSGDDMAADNFEKCLAVTLRWEGGYSNHPDDPGGPTMRGIIQREYDAFRKKRGLKPRPVRQIEEDELQTIYRANYWDAMNCETLPMGLDMAVFDAAVNSGVGRAERWLATSTVDHGVVDQINAFCNTRMEFLRGLGKLWRVFGAGWRQRVDGVRATSLTMAGRPVDNVAETTDLHAGMTGDAVTELQSKLRALGYPAGEVDGIFGPQLRRAVILFQEENELPEKDDPGVWRASYNQVLANAKPILPSRLSVGPRALQTRGDKPIVRLNALQRIFGWIFGASAVASVTDSDNVISSIQGAHDALQPLADAVAWSKGHVWLGVALAAVAAIVLVRLMRADHVKAYQDFTYQGPESKVA